MNRAAARRNEIELGGHWDSAAQYYGMFSED